MHFLIVYEQSHWDMRGDNPCKAFKAQWLIKSYSSTKASRPRENHLKHPRVTTPFHFFPLDAGNPMLRQQSQKGCCKFKASLVSIASSRPKKAPRWHSEKWIKKVLNVTYKATPEIKTHLFYLKDWLCSEHCYEGMPDTIFLMTNSSGGEGLWPSSSWGFRRLCSYHLWPYLHLSFPNENWEDWMGRAPSIPHTLPHLAATGRKNGTGIFAMVRAQEFKSQASSPT